MNMYNWINSVYSLPYITSLFPQNVPEFDTGDIVLFTGSSIIDRAFSYCASYKYKHIGIVLRDPIYISPNLKGTYFWESTFDLAPDSMDGLPKFGVMIHTLDHVLEIHKQAGDECFLRKLQHTSNTTGNCLLEFGYEENILDIFKTTQDIPYNTDVTEWILAQEASKSPSVETFLASHPCNFNDKVEINSMWCSEFVGYALSKMGVLVSDTQWCNLTPKSFGPDVNDLEFTEGYSFGPLISI